MGVRVPDRMRDGAHQTSRLAGSLGSRSAGRRSPPGSSAFPSWVAYLSSRVKTRRSRSSASGAGLEMTLTSPNSEKSSLGVPRPFCLLLSFIALFAELA